MSKIDWTKPVQTRRGEKVTVLTTTRNHPDYPVVALVTVEDEDGGLQQDMESFTKDGRYLLCETGQADLINVVERTSEFRSFAPRGGGHSGSMIFGGNVSYNLSDAMTCGRMFMDGEGVIELIREDGKLVDVKFYPLP